MTMIEIAVVVAAIAILGGAVLWRRMREPRRGPGGAAIRLPEPAHRLDRIRRAGL